MNDNEIEEILDRLALTRPRHYVNPQRAAEGKRRGAAAAGEWLRTTATSVCVTQIHHDCRGDWKEVDFRDDPEQMASLIAELTRLGRCDPGLLHQRDAFDRGFVDAANAFYAEHCKDWDDDDLLHVR